MAKRFAKSEIKKYLRENAAGASVTGLAEKYGFSTAAFYRWREKQEETKSSDAAELTIALNKEKVTVQALQKENLKLRGLLMEAMLR